MDPGTKQSVTTGISTILGALLVPAVAKYGFALSADQLTAISGYLVSGGAALFAILGALFAKLVHAPSGTVKATPATVAAANKEAGHVHIGMLASLLVVVTCLTACATLEAWFSSPAFVQALDAAIELVVGVVLDKAPNSAALAAQVSQDATALAQLSAGQTTNLAGLVAAAEAKINASTAMNPDEKLAFTSIITLAAAEIAQGAASASAKNPNATADLGVLFTDIANAANAYVTTTTVAAKAGLKIGYVPKREKPGATLGDEDGKPLF